MSYNAQPYIPIKGTALQYEDDGGDYQLTLYIYIGENMSVLNGASILESNISKKYLGM